MNVVWIFSFLTDSAFLWLYFRRSTYASNPQHRFLRAPLLLLSLILYLNTSLLTIPYTSVRMLVRTAVYFLWCFAAEGVPVRSSLHAALFWTTAYTLFQNLFFGPASNALFMGTQALVASPVVNQLLLSGLSVALRLLFFGSIALLLPFSGFGGVEPEHLALGAGLWLLTAYIKATGTPLLASFQTAPGQFTVFYYLMHLALLLVLVFVELVRRKTLESAALSVQNTEAAALLESVRERQESEESLRALRHDLKNHVISMQLLLEQGDTEGLAGYLDSLRTEAAATAGSFHTGNSLLDGLLKRKLAPAAERGIRVESTLDFSACRFLEPYELCVLMGNILDNAVEACSRSDAPETQYIRLSGGKTANCQLIRMENSYCGPGLSGGALPPTSKTDKRMHGFGLRNVRRVVDRYHGTMTITADRESFALNVLLPFPEEGEEKKA